jgi:hypothetical protein
MNLPRENDSKAGFSLVEVTLAIGIVGMAILSLVGILGSTFQQVDEIMMTNRAISGVTRLVGALDNPRSILWLTGDGASLNYLSVEKKAILDAPATGTSSSNFDIAYRLVNSSGWTAGNTASSTSKGVWLYVYERKLVSSVKEVTGTTYNISSNPSIMEVAACDSDDLNVLMAGNRNIVGVPMRVRITISKLLIGQPYSIDQTTLEPTTSKWPESGGKLNQDPNLYPLAYLPLVVEFYPHDYVKPTDPAGFKNKEQSPILVQNIVISR